MFLDMWKKMGCNEIEWSLNERDGESGAFHAMVPAVPAAQLQFLPCIVCSSLPCISQLTCLRLVFIGQGWVCVTCN